MQCQTCYELLIIYGHFISLLTAAVREIPRAGDDYWLAFAEAELLRLKCQEVNNDLTAHRLQEHRNLPKSGSRLHLPVPLLTWKRTISCQTSTTYLLPISVQPETT
jgi:hypothetical protein